jgi:hypothetical protein
MTYSCALCLMYYETVARLVPLGTEECLVPDVCLELLNSLTCMLTYADVC